VEGQDAEVVAWIVPAGNLWRDTFNVVWEFELIIARRDYSCHPHTARLLCVFFARLMLVWCLAFYAAGGPQ
jgi:hypothetical protein